MFPEYGDDPRTVDKLVDGVCFTRDDLHVWLAPYTSGKRHYVEINLGLLTTIAMIRIWNYNKSRVHTDRGVKDLIISLDERNIFMGEIRRSPGNLTDIEQSCEVLMFTSDPEIEHQIEEHDWVEKIELEDAIDTSAEERPSTASKKYTIEEMREMVVNVGDSLERPMTQAMTYVPQQNIKQQLAMKDKELAQLEKAEIGKKQTTSSVVGSQIIINILETWGDLFYVGLTGIAIYTDKDELVKLNIGNISASPSDLNSIPGYGGDYRTLDKLIDGVNVTTDDRHMWMIPFNKGLDHTIVIKFPRPIRLKCIRFYNYNKSVEDTFRGAKSLSVSVDGKLLQYPRLLFPREEIAAFFKTLIVVTPRRGVCIRKAPGNALFDYGFTLNLPYAEGWNSSEIALYKKIVPSSLLQEYYTCCNPTGFTFEVLLHSTKGDLHYIGLNGIEMYDLLGNSLLSGANRNYLLLANPSSVNTLKGMEADIRTIDKLVDGHNETADDRHMWLAPFKNTKVYAVTNREVAKAPNSITFSFNHMIALSAIKFWNYSKTPSRGANEISILCDHRLIYKGILNTTPTVIYFSENKKILDSVGGRIEYSGGKEQSVILVNERKTLNKRPKEYVDPKSFEIERPMTSVLGYK